MRITKVDIKNWRILHEPEALFQSSCAVIIGENGSGKSTLIELIMSVFDIVYKRLKRPNTLMELDGFCLEYVIKIVDNHVQIYLLIYPDNIKTYNTLEDLLNNFRVYNETLLEIEGRIVVYE